MVLRAARPDEIEDLDWNTPLADRIGLAVCTAVPFSSIDQDAKNGDLLLAASNACPAGLGMNLDGGLAIGARALHRRAWNINPASPVDVLVRFDVLLTHIRHAWIAHDDDLVWSLSQLRKQVAALIFSAHPEPSTKPRRPTNEKHRTILELVTGNALENEPFT